MVRGLTTLLTFLVSVLLLAWGGHSARQSGSRAQVSASELGRLSMQLGKRIQHSGRVLAAESAAPVYEGAALEIEAIASPDADSELPALRMREQVRKPAQAKAPSQSEAKSQAAN